MPSGYGTHSEYMEWVKTEAAQRQSAVEDALRSAFSRFIEKRQVEVVLFETMTALDLADSVIAYPIILKSILASSNLAARAIERDLGIKNIDTYSPQLTKDSALVIAGYLKNFLPAYMEIPALSHLDRIGYVDKEIRKGKGRWENRIVSNLNKYGALQFRKRRFAVEGEEFELDAATPLAGQVEIGVDIKRIEARRDIHKRCDEIVNKASKLRAAFPSAKFGAVIYYPFIDEHANVQSRLRSPDISVVVFASDSDDSIETATRLLVATLEG